MPNLPAFQRYQFEFTRHIRDPKRYPRPMGVAARRMKIYNELLYHNVESFLLACFPVVRKVLGKRAWGKMVRDFFATHRSRSPLFRRIPEEFLRYLNEERGSRAFDPPYLRHLAHYEWVELALDLAPDETGLESIDRAGDLLEGRPALNPALHLLSYPWPVHRIGPRHRPKQGEETHILAFRDLRNNVRFVVLNAVSARLLALLQKRRLTGRQALAQIARELKHLDPETVAAGGRELLEKLRAQDAVLGVWRA